MLAGFDYGTSNCAIGVVNKNPNNTASVEAVLLEASSQYLPSLVYAECRESIVEFVAHGIQNNEVQKQFANARTLQLAAATRYRTENGIPTNEQLVSFGAAAMAQYVLAPEEGIFAKSPKSFLGASGLQDNHLTFFEDIVTAMMMKVNQQVAKVKGKTIESVVIGRPVNFTSINSEQGNIQAINILTAAAKRSGYKNIEFLYEPLAAGLAFEQTLVSNKLVLVLDIGGGTSDCSMMHMGPSYQKHTERADHFLAHTGILTGGNDLDIALAAKAFMPLMGMESHTKDGLPLPAKMFWNAVRVNDANAQAKFYSPENAREVHALMPQVQQPTLFARYAHMLKFKKNFSVIKASEQAKIALSTQLQFNANLNNIEKGLAAEITRESLALAIEQPLSQIAKLVTDTVKQAGSQPDLVFITGGSGQSPIIREAISRYFGNIQVVDGDHFGSVVKGLTQWAGAIFR